MNGQIGPRVVAVAVASTSAPSTIRDWLTVNGIAGRHPLLHMVRTLSSIQPVRLIAIGTPSPNAPVPRLGNLDANVEELESFEGGQALKSAVEGVTEGDLLVVIPDDVPLLDSATMLELIGRHAEVGAEVTALVAAPGAASADRRGWPLTSASVGPRVRLVQECDLLHDQVRALLMSGPGVPDCETLDWQSPWDALVELAVDGQEAGVATLVCSATDPWETQRIESAATAGAVCCELNRRLVQLAIQGGAVILDPATTWIDSDVTVSAGATILPGTHLEGRTSIAPSALVGPDTTLRDTVVSARAVVARSQADQTTIGEDARVGPFVQLRPGTQIGARARVGSFVELKNADLGEGAKVPHLIYLGDVTVGAGGNIGGGSITANYDGERKHRTLIGTEVRIGSNNTLVAPVSVGDGAYTGSGTVVREDVPPGALAVSAGRQRNIEGWVIRKRSGSPSAAAAERAQAAASH